MKKLLLSFLLLTAHQFVAALNFDCLIVTQSTEKGVRTVEQKIAMDVGYYFDWQIEDVLIELRAMAQDDRVVWVQCAIFEVGNGIKKLVNESNMLCSLGKDASIAFGERNDQTGASKKITFSVIVTE
jgi:hypothetical protein